MNWNVVSHKHVCLMSKTCLKAGRRPMLHVPMLHVPMLCVENSKAAKPHAANRCVGNWGIVKSSVPMSSIAMLDDECPRVAVRA